MERGKWKIELFHRAEFREVLEGARVPHWNVDLVVHWNDGGTNWQEEIGDRSNWRLSGI